MPKRTGARLAACMMLMGIGPASQADDPVPVSSRTGTLSYIHLYSGADGVSHFSEKKLYFKPLRDAPPASPLSIAELMSSEGAVLLALRSGATEDWHPAPRRQFVIALKGLCEVTAGDGRKRRLTPGTILLMDDTTGKGHVTRSIGPEDHVALMIPVTAIPTAPSTDER